jgi:hypothetical protein
VYHYQNVLKNDRIFTKFSIPYFAEEKVESEEESDDDMGFGKLVISPEVFSIGLCWNHVAAISNISVLEGKKVRCVKTSSPRLAWQSSGELFFFTWPWLA